MEPTYVLLEELKGRNNAPINALLFSDNAKYLLAAGDAEKVYVWNTETFECKQVLEDVSWGPLTSMTWIYRELPSREISTTLCVGNVRGTLSLYPLDLREAKPFPKPATHFSPFIYNDSVEKLAFDKLNRRLAVASHSGEIKMYDAGAASLVLLWEGRLGNVIPTGLLFYGGANQSLLTAALESSEISCRNASNNTLSWKKTVVGGIGCAAMASDETLLLVNNLTTGNFDVYNVSDDTPLRSLPVGSTRRFAKQCQFFEGSKLAVCGSDTNKVHVVDVVQNYVVQTLITGKEQDLTQTVAVTPASSRRAIIAAACHGSVYLWEKGGPTASIRRVSKLRRFIKAFFYYDLHICFLILLVTCGAWFPYYCTFVSYFTAKPLWPCAYGSVLKAPATVEPAVSVQPSFVVQPSIALETFVPIEPSVATQSSVAIESSDRVETPVGLQTSVAVTRNDLILYF